MDDRKKSPRPVSASARNQDDWLGWAVDALASEYGWSKREILEEVYPDELVTLVPLIERRKIDEYKMQMAIVQNPHVKDPKRLWKIIGQSSDHTRPEKLDVSTIENLKAQLSKGSRLVVK